MKAVCVYWIPSIVVLVAVSVSLIQQSVWWAGYDIRNCPGCKPTVNWTKALGKDLDAATIEQFQSDGVVVLENVLNVDKVKILADTADSLPNTIMTDVVAAFLLKFYLKYEHRLETRSELIRDWAIHGPLGKWAAQLMGVDRVLLYNSEAIYHKGEDSPVPCEARWHRDTIAAPFSPHLPSVTFNVYLDDIDGQSDGLIYMKGSHKDIYDPPARPEIIEPRVKVGDLLAHAPNSYHTVSGRNCWKRRSLQFRYVAANFPGTATGTLTEAGSALESGPARLEFDANRFPHGAAPWTLAHSPLLAPHGLENGDVLQGPWYPQVYPHPLQAEHAPAPGRPWTIQSLTKVVTQASNWMASGEAENQPPSNFFGLDGYIKDPSKWRLINQPANSDIKIPVHVMGESYKKSMKGNETEI